MSDSLDNLFPVPSLSPSRLSPGRSPGVSPESTETLQKVLKDNHVKWHIFFNDLRFHNHAAHRAIAAWALGADADVIQKAYERDCNYEKPAIKSPQQVISWKNHLGDDRFFDAYTQFFVQRVEEQGIGSTIEEFVFSGESNFSENGERQPQMLNRFFAGVLHPLIHTGHSAEFSLPGMLVEGLAQVAVHHTVPGLLEPLLLFEGSLADNAQIVAPVGAKVVAKDDPHALTILARVLRDARFHPSPVDRNDSGYDKTIDQHSKGIASYVNAWNIDPAILEGCGWESKVEEIVWTVVVLYGIAGWTHGRGKPRGFIADFFLMHLVTSSVFLPSLCAVISPVSRSRLLRTYLAVSCIWAVARGQPTLDVKGFVEAMKWPAADPDGAPQVDPKNGNLWDKIFGEARENHDEHVTKITRSLAGWASVFGTRKARLPLKKKPDPGASANVESKERGIGEDDSNATMSGADYLPPTELPGSEYLDGSLFLRVAVLTLRRMGWEFERARAERPSEVKDQLDNEQEEPEFWDFQGFFEYHESQS